MELVPQFNLMLYVIMLCYLCLVIHVGLLCPFPEARALPHCDYPTPCSSVVLAGLHDWQLCILSSKGSAWPCARPHWETTERIANAMGSTQVRKKDSGAFLFNSVGPLINKFSSSATIPGYSRETVRKQDKRALSKLHARVGLYFSLLHNYI